MPLDPSSHAWTNNYASKENDTQMVIKTDDYCNTKIRYEWKRLIQSPANPGAHLGQRPVAALPKEGTLLAQKELRFLLKSAQESSKNPPERLEQLLSRQLAASRQSARITCPEKRQEQKTLPKKQRKSQIQKTYYLI